jgi:hypothetical protein
MKGGARYARLEAGVWDSKKVARVSLDAVGLWAKMLSYCADKVTDGVVPSFMVPALAPNDDPAPLLTELMGSGMLLEHPDGYEIHSYLDHNMSAKEWESKKKSERDRKRSVRKDSARTNRGHRKESQPNPNGRTPDTEPDSEGIPARVSSSISRSKEGGAGGGLGPFADADPAREGMAVTDGTVVAACPQCGSPVVARPSQYGGMWAPCTNRSCKYKIPKLSGNVLQAPGADADGVTPEERERLELQIRDRMGRGLA